MALTQERNSGPTTLELFSYSPSRRYEIAQSREGFRSFRGEFISLKTGYEKFEKATEERQGRLVRAAVETTEEVKVLRSSRTVGTAFLKMSEELESEGFSSGQIMEVFLRCLEINTALTGNRPVSKSPDEIQKSLLSLIAGEKRRTWDNVRVIRDQGRHPPEAFNGDAPKWLHFLASHIFITYLNSPRDLKRPLLSLKNTPLELGNTFEVGYPDWLIDNGGSFPLKEQVLAELEEDTNLENTALVKMENLKIQEAASMAMIDNRFRPAAARVEAGRREKWEQVNSFPELLLYLEATEGIVGYALNPQQILTGERKNLYRYRISPEQVFDRTVAGFMQSETVFSSPETIALYLERKLREGRVVMSGKDNIDEERRRFLRLILEPTVPGQESSQDLQALQSSAKKAYSIIKYDLQPLLYIVNDPDKNYLKEVIGEMNIETVEDAIRDIAEMVGGSYKTEDRPDYPASTKKTLEELRRLTSSWTKNNWKWAVRRLHEFLDSKEDTKEPAQKSGDENKLESSSIQQQIESSLQEVEEGNLSGWKLKYTTTMRLDDKSLVEIGGRTIAEREAALDKFIRTEGISCSVGADSVIAALEWLTTVPEEIEWLRMRKKVGNVDFKKLRRGPVRILYRMDSDIREMVFFLHQKKAWSYGF